MELNRAILEAQGRVHEALLDNINTQGALDALAALVKATNLYLSRKQAQRQQQQQDGGANANSSSSTTTAAAAAGPGDAGALATGLVSPLLLNKAAAYVTRILSVMGLVPVSGVTLV
jgi:cysteinyl-tRNA synthetase